MLSRTMHVNFVAAEKAETLSGTYAGVIAQPDSKRFDSFSWSDEAGRFRDAKGIVTFTGLAKPRHRPGRLFTDRGVRVAVTVMTSWDTETLPLRGTPPTMTHNVRFSSTIPFDAYPKDPQIVGRSLTIGHARTRVSDRDFQTQASRSRTPNQNVLRSEGLPPLLLVRY